MCKISKKFKIKKDSNFANDFKAINPKLFYIFFFQIRCVSRKVILLIPLIKKKRLSFYNNLFLNMFKILSSYLKIDKKA